jgi:pimeloyl-ACP methyl ester carboxylesterase
MKLNVHEWGTGDRTALLIHGLFADHQNWYRVGPALAERGYRVIAPDLRGHGASPRGAYSPELWAADLVESLPKNADLAIGHSLAGMALALAAKELAVRRAIYVDPTWKNGEPVLVLRHGTKLCDLRSVALHPGARGRDHRRRAGQSCLEWNVAPRIENF